MRDNPSNFLAVHKILMTNHVYDVLVTPTGENGEIPLHHAASGRNQESSQFIMEELLKNWPYSQLHAETTNGLINGNNAYDAATDLNKTYLLRKTEEGEVQFGDYLHHTEEHILFLSKESSARSNARWIAERICAKRGICRFLIKPAPG